MFPDWDDDVQAKSFFSLLAVIFGIVLLIIAALLHSAIPGELYENAKGFEVHRTLPIIVILYVLGGLTFGPGLFSMFIINSDCSDSDFSWIRRRK